MISELPVSLIIPVYNRIEKVRNLFESIENSNFSCEVIVVDDCSTEDISAVCQEFQDEINLRYFRNSKNMGPSYSRNMGINKASHQFIAFTDNDCIVSKDWLIKLHEYISNVSENVVGVGGRTLALGKDLLSQYYDYNKILDPWYYNGRRLYIVSANAIFKKKQVLNVGGFDQTVTKAGGEDVGLCLKLINSGYELAYYPEALIFHDYERSLKNFYRTFFTYGYGCHVQYSKYYEKQKYSNPGYGGME